MNYLSTKKGIDDMNGWIKLHRKLLDSKIFSNPNILKFWVWALLKASHSDAEQLVGLQTVTIKKGQFVFGRKVASKELDMTESNAYKILKWLEKEKMITVNSNNKFSLITVVNWDFYQGCFDEEGQQSNSKVTTTKQQNNNKGTSKEQQSNTNKNEKNEKKKNTSRHKFETCDMEMAELLLSLILENNPEYKKPNLESWANECRLIRERDNRKLEAIEYLIKWSQKNEFWWKNILSMATLRKQFDKLVAQCKSEVNKKNNVVPIRENRPYSNSDELFEQFDKWEREAKS